MTMTMTMTMTIAEAARRSIDDQAFAQAVLDGTEDFPEVRAAILADLRALGDETDVQGFLNPQPLPPGYADRPGSGPEESISLTFQKIDFSSISWGATMLPSVRGLANAS